MVASSESSSHLTPLSQFAPPLKQTLSAPPLTPLPAMIVFGFHSTEVSPVPDGCAKAIHSRAPLATETVAFSPPRAYWLAAFSVPPETVTVPVNDGWSPLTMTVSEAATFTARLTVPDGKSPS